MVACVFPGQGSQYVGMGKDFYQNSDIARKRFREADEELGFSLLELCSSGPEEELEKTENSQPAIFTVSLICWEILRNSIPSLKISFTAGHSLGEFSAIAASGSMTFEDGISLVRKRGLFMAESAGNHPGAMAAVIGLQMEKIGKICNSFVSIANLNCPGQVVISGDRESLQNVCKTLRKEGARIIPLPVSGAFHSPLMQDASLRFSGETENVHICNPDIPMISNVTADIADNSETIRNNLKMQILNPVRWEESIRRMVSEGVHTFIEVGPGRVLSKLTSRINANSRVGNVEDRRSLAEAVKLLCK